MSYVIEDIIKKKIKESFHKKILQYNLKIKFQKIFLSTDKIPSLIFKDKKKSPENSKFSRFFQVANTLFYMLWIEQASRKLSENKNRIFYFISFKYISM